MEVGISKMRVAVIASSLEPVLNHIAADWTPQGWRVLTFQSFQAEDFRANWRVLYKSKNL